MDTECGEVTYDTHIRSLEDVVKVDIRFAAETVKYDLPLSSNIILDTGNKEVSVTNIENLKNEDTVNIKVKPDNPPSSCTALDIDLD